DIPLTPETAIEAFNNGLYPWEDLGEKAAWYSPAERGVLDIEELHVSRSLAKLRKKNRFTTTIDEAFESVARSCVVHEGRDVWLTEKFIETFIELHRRGIAHSVEVWE